SAQSHESRGWPGLEGVHSSRTKALIAAEKERGKSMKVKYGVLLVTALVIALLVPGFGRGGASQTITFLTAPWGVPPDQALLKAFTDRSGITVQVISAPSAEMYTKVQVASAGKGLRAGGFAKPAGTGDELRRQSVALKQKGVDQYPIAFGAIDWSWFLMALSAGDPMFDGGLNPVFSNAGSPARKAMATLIGFFATDKVITRDLLTKVTPHDGFLGGTAVYHQAWQGSLAVMNNAKISKQAPDVQYLLMPEQHFTWSLDAAIGLSRFSAKKDAGWEFIKWYVSPESQRAIYKAVGLVPSRKSLQQALNSEGAIQGFETMVEQAKYVHQLPRTVKWWGPWTQSVTEAIRKAAQGQLTPDAAVDAVAKRWNELKAQYKQ